MAEHRLIPARARSIGHQRRRAERQSVWAPSLVTPEFKEYFWLGRAMRVTLPTGEGGVVHLLWFMGVRGLRRMLKNFCILISYSAPSSQKPRWCVGQPLLVVGDLNADPGIIPCLAKGIAAGRFVDLALAHSIGAGKEPEVTCRFRLDDCAGSWRDSIVACPNALAASCTCHVTDRWFTPHFPILNGLLRCLAPVPLSLFGLQVGLTLRIGRLPPPLCVGYLGDLSGGVVGCLS